MFGSTKREVAETGAHGVNSIIGKKTSLKGDLDTSGNIRVEGKVIGSVQTKAKLVLGATAVLEGDIVAQTAEIAGEVRGTIAISGLLMLKSTAVVKGDIHVSKLVFEEGAKFDGRCHMRSASGEYEGGKHAKTLLQEKSSSLAVSQPTQIQSQR